jgi:hypothetical protein
LHVSKHALLVSFAKCFNLVTWLPSLNLAAKFETWQPISNLADITEGTRGKHIKTKKTWQPNSNLAGPVPSSSLAAKFETWQKLRNLAGSNVTRVVL